MTPQLRLLEVPAISSLDDPEVWKYHGMQAVHSSCWERIYGNTDEALTLKDLIIRRRNEIDFSYKWMVAVLGDHDSAESIVGSVTVDMRTRDNRDKADISVWVSPSMWRQSVGTTLLTWAEEAAHESGRTMMTAWTFFGAHENQPPRVLAPDGTDLPAESPGIAFLLKHGYDIALVERRSQMDLPLDPELRSQLMNETLPRTEGYQLHTWVSTVPEEWIEPLAQLYSDFSTDAPTGEVDYEKEVWDRDQILRRMTEMREREYTVLATAAESIATGELAGYTELVWRTTPVIPAGEQWITEVVNAHRGHRLGMWMKLVNLEKMLSLRPDIRRVYTSNAEENVPMLGINTALGFYPAGGYVLLKKTLATT